MCYVLCISLLFIIISPYIYCKPKSFYTNEWVIQVEGGAKDAVHVASTYGLQLLGEVFPYYYHYKQHGRTRRSVRPSLHTHRRLLRHPKITTANQVLWKLRHNRDTSFNDQFWSDMWYIRSASPSMKVSEAWNLGYRGDGVTIGIVDDGVEVNHPDLAANIARTSSYDFFANDGDPSPSLSSRGHGTKCAGAAAAVANDSLCGVGSAYKAKIAGIRASDGGSSSVMEARSLNHDWNNIQIYSNSWGGEDKKGFDGPDAIVNYAIIRGIVQGRSGYGSIYVWAAGNGENEDNCNADGYTNSIYTIAISSVNSDGYAASFSEVCSAAMAVTYSQSTSTSNIVTTKMGGGCDKSFTGTSASAPMAAGIIALALQAKNDMTWRDVQHLIVNTAQMSGLHGRDIASNGAGKRFSNFFGFGLLDAEAMVSHAANWTLVPSQRTCTSPNIAVPNGRINGSTRQIFSKVQSKGCEGMSGEVKFLEHVVTEITFSATQRGQVELFLTSPRGTTTTLLSVRPADTPYSGSITWSYMSVHFWGEDPEGNWTLKMYIRDTSTSGSLDKWKLTLHGTNIDPKLGIAAEPDPVTMTVPTTTVRGVTKPKETSADIIIEASTLTTVTDLISSVITLDSFSHRIESSHANITYSTTVSHNAVQKTTITLYLVVVIALGAFIVIVVAIIAFCIVYKGKFKNKTSLGTNE
ncbi:furin-like [Ostrea edulis]|uniref:furin-like n=1 Tax=Ostrea edulis TaxID=37623 RepID=UPI0024AFF026|nr:furin-like [Ostrea edulis]